MSKQKESQEPVVLPPQTEGEPVTKAPKPEKHDLGKCGDCEGVA